MAALIRRATRLSRSNRLWVLALSVGLAVQIAAAPGGSRAESRPEEYEVKGAFLLNFARLVEWPEAAFGGDRAPLVVGALGPDDFVRTLRSFLEGKAVGEHPLRVQRIAGADAIQSKDLHIVYVHASKRGHHAALIEAARGTNSLTVGESDGFADDGGIINFYWAGNKIRFEVNRGAAQRAGLQISSRLLRVAKLVTGGGE